MIIDVSNTLGRHKFKPEVKAESLLEEMDKSGIDMAVIGCYAEYIDNDSIFNAIHTYPDRFTGLFTVNPWEESSVEQLEHALATDGFKGLHMNPLRHGYMLCEHEVFYPLLNLCRKYKVPVWCYGAAEVFSSPIFFQSIASDYPDVNFIMGRMGLQYDNASAVEIARKFKNVFLETSSSMDFNVKRAIKISGAEQVLFGTGTPEAGYFELELKKVRNAAALFEGAADKVLGENAARIFGIGEVE